MKEVICSECIEVMKTIPDSSIDAIITDLPFGVTQNTWDRQISLGDLWREYTRISKPTTPIILFGQGMFTAELMISNPHLWKYNLVWEKSTVTGFLNANRQPLRSHEDIVVFYEKQPTYNPQKVLGSKNHSRGSDKICKNSNYNGYGFQSESPENNGMKFPRSVLHFDTVPPSHKIHPTEKPVPLLEWLVKTYTNIGDVVLDNCCGCGSTLVACKKNGRRYIGIDINQTYCNKAMARLGEIE